MYDISLTILAIASLLAIGYAWNMFHAYMRQSKLGLVGLGIFYTVSFLLSPFETWYGLLGLFVIACGYFYLLIWSQFSEWVTEKVFKGESQWQLTCGLLLIPLCPICWFKYKEFVESYF